MKKDIKKSIMPATVAPVQRETAAAVSRDGSAIALLILTSMGYEDRLWDPFAGDDAQ